jgi:hypothetical protein
MANQATILLQKRLANIEHRLNELAKNVCQVSGLLASGTDITKDIVRRIIALEERCGKNYEFTEKYDGEDRHADREELDPDRCPDTEVEAGADRPADEENGIEKAGDDGAVPDGSNENLEQDKAEGRQDGGSTGEVADKELLSGS